MTTRPRDIKSRTRNIAMMALLFVFVFTIRATAVGMLAISPSEFTTGCKGIVYLTVTGQTGPTGTWTQIQLVGDKRTLPGSVSPLVGNSPQWEYIAPCPISGELMDEEWKLIYTLPDGESASALAHIRHQ